MRNALRPRLLLITTLRYSLVDNTTANKHISMLSPVHISTCIYMWIGASLNNLCHLFTTREARLDWKTGQLAGEQCLYTIACWESANNSCSLTSVWACYPAREGRSRGARFSNQCFHILRKEDMGEWRACPSWHEKNAGWVVVSNKYHLSDICLYLNNTITLEKIISV